VPLSRRRTVTHLALVATATLVFSTVAVHSGRAGSLARALDGHEAYETAVRAGMRRADPATRSRPLVIRIARDLSRPSSPLRLPMVRLGEVFDLAGDDTQRVFELLNVVYAALLAWLLCALLDAYGATTPLKAIVLLNVFVTAAIARVPGYQPAQIQLGACVFITMAMLAVVAGRRWAIVPATMLAVAAHPIGLAVLLFGVYRDWRRHIPRARSLATYVPAAAACLAIQFWAHASAAPALASTSWLAGAVLFERPQAFANASFLLMAGYGAVTLFGGVSLFLIARAIRGQVPIGDEQEWLVYLGAVLVGSIVAGFGTWTVLAYSLPAVAVLFTRAASTTGWRELALMVGLGTLATQHPWAAMTDVQYLAAWAPSLPAARSLLAEPHASLMWIARLGFVAWFVYSIARAGRTTSLAAFGIGAAVLLSLLTDVSGQIPVNGGFGYDGRDYVRIFERSFDTVLPSALLRPVIVLINDQANTHYFHDPIATFRAMNIVYACALAVILAGLCRRYGASPAATAVFIVNLFLCISIAKMFAFYPVLVDLGAYSFMAASVWAIVAGRRWPIVVTTVLAVLSREFAAVNVLFGVARDLRTRQPLPVIAATYAPAVIAFFWVRRVAAGFVQESEITDPVLSIGALVTALLSNVGWWSDPMYVAFWSYFAATLFGGLSLFLLITLRQWWPCLRDEPEWLAFIVPLVAVTVLGYTDMWRYSAFLVPALPVFWAWSVRRLNPGRDLLLFAVLTAATVATQRPWQRMDLSSYFRDWFPYYVVERRVPFQVELWPTWSYYLIVAIASLAALALVRGIAVPRVCYHRAALEGTHGKR
jgi:hypothetical protein